MGTLKIAVVQAAPVWMDREATVDKVASLVKEAAGEGAGVVAFPETFVPGYPWWAPSDDLRLMSTPLASQRQAWYLREAVNIERGDLDPIVAAAREADSFVSVGIAELAPSGGSVYASMVMIHPELGVVGVHRKLKPTYVERVSWADGDGHGLRVHDWNGWKIGGLNCWENWLPLPRFSLYSQGEQLHIACWPGFTANTSGGITSFIAQEAGIYVASVCGLIGRDLIPTDFPGAEALAEALLPSMGDGGSMICRPDGRVIAEAALDTEEIIYADLDQDAVTATHMMRDVAGHYNRPDVFDLTVDRTRNIPVTFTD